VSRLSRQCGIFNISQSYRPPWPVKWINVKIRIYKNIIVVVVLYGCGTWSLTLREEHRLKVFENRTDEVTGGWGELHNEELRDLYFSPSIIRIIKLRRMRWGGHIVRIGEKRNAYRILVGKSEGRRPLLRPRRSWEDIILRWILETYDGVVWTGLIWLRMGTSGGLL
jgi:hypothetical protein